MHLRDLTSNITITCRWGARIPVSQQDDWQRQANGYTCTLNNRALKRRMTVDFWQGMGIREAPTAVGVLSCLLSDASSAENSSNFEEFCADLGYDTDSRQAEHTYEACLAVAEKLKKFLGPDYETFMRAEPE
jgi:hypothetical protein